ncbi:solute carrier family 35 member D3-like [Tachypleus tridentatus]|uniref:solute carrier family 35 member D3-like n=1 Tax=Tachypleus tridentatus TaxID=6853 RepID=UPI003FD1F7E7
MYDFRVQNMATETKSVVKLIISAEDVESNHKKSQAEEGSRVKNSQYYRILEQGKKASWIACVVSSLAFILCSGSLVFVLKYLTLVKEFYFPFFITTVRVMFTLLVLEVLRNLKLINLSVLTLEESQSFLWPTICYIVQITTSLAALKGMSIPLYTSIKRCGPLVNMILSIMLLKKKTPSWLSQVSVILAAIGCMISGTGELTVNYQGYVNVVVCLVSESFYFTLVEAQNYRVLKFVQLLCYNSLPVLLFMSWFTDELGQAFSFLHFSDPQVLTLFVLTVVIGACLVVFLDEVSEEKKSSGYAHLHNDLEKE